MYSIRRRLRLIRMLADYRPAKLCGRPAAIALRARADRADSPGIHFDSGATTIGTPVGEVWQHRRGVCQDFAHLEIGCLRSLGLAARYVSGYVVTRPPPGHERLAGADASHAWLSVYIPEVGWVDFDPTNGVMPANEHVTIGWARDYDDVSPVEGVTSAVTAIRCMWASTSSRLARRKRTPTAATVALQPWKPMAKLLANRPSGTAFANPRRP